MSREFKKRIKGKDLITTLWSAHLAYAIGLIVTDGSLSKDGRHITLASKDLEQLINFKKALGIKNRIGLVLSGNRGRSFRVQVADVRFYNFLMSLGIYPNKSKTISDLLIPSMYFSDFVRGNLDGDGSVTCCRDKRWRAALVVNTSFASASYNYLLWLREKIRENFGIAGNLPKRQIIEKSCYQLRYSKKDSIVLWKWLYYSESVLCLGRKRLKIKHILDMMSGSIKTHNIEK